MQTFSKRGLAGLCIRRDIGSGLTPPLRNKHSLEEIKMTRESWQWIISDLITIITFYVFIVHCIIYNKISF